MPTAGKAWDEEGTIMTSNLDLRADGSVLTRDGKLNEEDFGRQGLYTVDFSLQ